MFDSLTVTGPVTNEDAAIWAERQLAHGAAPTLYSADPDAIEAALRARRIDVSRVTVEPFAPVEEQEPAPEVTAEQTSEATDSRSPAQKWWDGLLPEAQERLYLSLTAHPEPLSVGD